MYGCGCLCAFGHAGVYTTAAVFVRGWQGGARVRVTMVSSRRAPRANANACTLLGPKVRASSLERVGVQQHLQGGIQMRASALLEDLCVQRPAAPGVAQSLFFFVAPAACKPPPRVSVAICQLAAGTRCSAAVAWCWLAPVHGRWMRYAWVDHASKVRRQGGWRAVHMRTGGVRIGRVRVRVMAVMRLRCACVCARVRVCGGGGN